MSWCLHPEDKKDLKKLVDEALEVLTEHQDNTGAACRVDLRGHDCCYVCNRMQDTLEVWRKWYDE